MATQMAGPAELVVDVSAALPFDEPTSIVASVHLPDPEDEGPHAVLICWPGGSYARVLGDGGSRVSGLQLCRAYDRPGICGDRR